MADIGICRCSQKEEINCNDGIDNDCDGFTDKADKDCMK
jgi:hypothetical protein